MKPSTLTIALYPNISGMGYVICETPKELINYGIARVQPLTSNMYVRRLHKFINFYKPTLILLRDYENTNIKMSKRIRKVIDSFEKEAQKLDVPIFKYSRQDIKEVFKQFEGDSKYAISKTLSNWYPELKRLMPDIRKYPDPEHYQMGVFDAFSLMLTHHYLE